MKIGIDIRTLMDAHYSGVPEYTYNLIKEILKQDKKNSYKLFYNSYGGADKNIPKFEGNNVEIIGTKYPNKIFNFLMQKTLGKPNIDQLLGVDLFFMPNIGFVSLSDKCKKIITIHDLSFLRYKDFFSLKRRLWHSIIDIKRLINNFDKIIAVSKNTKQDIIELCGVNPEKIKVIYSAVGTQFRQIGEQDIEINKIKNRYNLPKKFILFLGTLEPRKNVEGIISAFNKLRDNNRFDGVKLIIAGTKGWKFGNIFKAWQESKHKDDIQFLGYVDDSDKVFLYNLASIFVYPSFYEGFGFPPLEAMACGTPVIVSSVSSLPEVFEKSVITVDPYNITNIAQAIELVLADNNLRDRLIKQGMEQANKFSWQDTARQYLEILRE